LIAAMTAAIGVGGGIGLWAVAVLGGLCFVPAAIAAAMSRSKPGAISGNAPAG